MRYGKFYVALLCSTIYGGGYASATVYDSAINVTEDMTFEDATFEGLEPKDYPAWSVLYNSGGGDLTFNGNTVFKNNVVSNGPGGIIYNTGKSVLFNGDVIFDGNSAGTGGAINNQGGSLTFEGKSTFNNNTSLYGSGGAIYNLGGNLTFKDTAIFTGNQPRYANSGGTIYSQGGSLNMVDALFEDSSGGYGGAIYLYGSSLSIGDVAFRRNFGDGEGGAAYLYSGMFSFNGKTVFEDNTARSTGGAIYFKGGNLTFEDDVDFINNAAKENYSGALHVDGGVVSFSGNTRFEGNSAGGTRGGAIYNDSGTMFFNGDNNIFIGNTIDRQWGGAISNKGTIVMAKGYFEGNKVLNCEGGTVCQGGAIFNNTDSNFNADGTVLYADFYNNEAFHQGGAIYNTGVMGDIVGNFVGNKAMSKEYWYGGGAIYTSTKLGLVKGNFYQNEAGWGGGAILASGDISKIHYNGDASEASFYQNKALHGGAIFNSNTIDEIVGLFMENEATGTDEISGGGALFNRNKIGSIIASDMDKALFYGNKSAASGGAIENRGTIDSILGGFSNNMAALKGGAIYNVNTIGDISGVFSANRAASGGAVFNEGAIAFTDARFEANEATDLGGAIYNTVTGNITLNGVNYFGSNTANGELNDIYNEGKITLAGAVYGDDGSVITSGAQLMLDGGILGHDGVFEIGTDAELYSGKDTLIENKVISNGKIVVEDGRRLTVDNDVQLNSGSTFVLGKTAEVNITGDLIGDVIDSFVAASDDVTKSFIKVNMTIDENNIARTGVINVAGDVSGKFHVIFVSDSDEAPKEDTRVTFLRADNYTTEGGAAAQIIVDRVYMSPYMWEAREEIVDINEEDPSSWYLIVSGSENENAGVADPDQEAPSHEIFGTEPDVSEEEGGTDTPDINEPAKPDVTKPNKPSGGRIYTPEVAGFTTIQQLAVEQNRSIADSVARGIATEKSKECYQESCGVAELMPKKEAWIVATHESAKFKKPATVDGDINGVTLGIDFLRDAETRAGVFGAYRNGDFDTTGAGELNATSGADIKNKSWLGGAYYRWSDTEWSVFGTIFAGKQSFDLDTKDKIVSASGDATQYGASAEITRRFEVRDRVYVSPFVGAYYSLIDFNDMHDNMGKTAKFDTLNYGEVEVGSKFEYVICNEGLTNRLYFKPSVIQTFASGGETRITGLNDKVDTFKDRTLGRMEVGGEWSFNDRLNVSANTGYTFGQDYHGYDVNVGLSLRF